jgi:hypothetical protein
MLLFAWAVSSKGHRKCSSFSIKRTIYFRRNAKFCMV